MFKFLTKLDIQTYILTISPQTIFVISYRLIEYIILLYYSYLIIKPFIIQIPCKIMK